MMAVRCTFEIGHEACIERPGEAYTHDWRVWVRGADAADIHHYVDRVVFHLHDTFPKPKRQLKDPPYLVKESGYAGFLLPIEIYFKNKDEPKKVRYEYNLHLQPNGPPIMQSRRERFVFQNPSDDFRRKLLKGGAVPVFQDQEPPKPKPALPSNKPRPPRIEEPPRPSANFVNLFGPPIHKTSRISPDPKKPSPKSDKKDKDKGHPERDRPKIKHDHRDDRKALKDDREKFKDEKKPKPHKEREPSVKDKTVKRPSERISPGPPVKRPAVHPPTSPRRVSSPNDKSSGSASSREDVKPAKNGEPVDVRSKKIPDVASFKTDKKSKIPNEKERDSKKSYKKETKINYPPEPAAVKDVKPFAKEPPIKDSNGRDKPAAAAKPFNKFSIENMLKDPQDAGKFGADTSKHKTKGDQEKKHKHKKKDKKRDESREKVKDAPSKDKKHKHDRHKEKMPEPRESLSVPEKEPIIVPKENDKSIIRNLKERERSQYTISPISLDTSSQSSSKSANKPTKPSKVTLGSSLSGSSSGDSDNSVLSDEEDTSFNSESSKSHKNNSKIRMQEQMRSEPPPKMEKFNSDKVAPINQNSNHKPPKKSREKPPKESKEEKKRRKRNASSKTDDSENSAKNIKLNDNDIQDHRLKRQEDKGKNDVSRAKPDEGNAHPVKCDSPAADDDQPRRGVPNESNGISTEYIVQLQELQRRIMTIQSSDELERVVNLIAETGKYEVTKKSFDFDLCSLDRSTVQQLQELIGCESRA